MRVVLDMGMGRQMGQRGSAVEEHSELNGTPRIEVHVFKKVM